MLLHQMHLHLFFYSLAISSINLVLLVEIPTPSMEVDCWNSLIISKIFELLLREARFQIHADVLWIKVSAFGQKTYLYCMRQGKVSYNCVARKRRVLIIVLHIMRYLHLNIRTSEQNALTKRVTKWIMDKGGRTSVCVTWPKWVSSSHGCDCQVSGKASLLYFLT